MENPLAWLHPKKKNSDHDSVTDEHVVFLIFILHKKQKLKPTNHPCQTTKLIGTQQ